MLKVLTILLSLLLNSCMVGPDYKEPTKPVANQWIKDKTIKKPARANALWWHVFHDPTLTALINRGYQNNLSLHSAAVHVLQTRAQLAQSVGELYPQQQTMMGNLTYNRIGGQSLQDVLPSNFKTALLGFTASWELDFWGKYRRAILSNDANFLASIAAYDNALVTLTADIASTYVDIRMTEALIKITKQNVQVQRIALKIAQSRFRAGETSLLDVEQAKTELTQTQAAIPTYESNLRKQKDALGVLLGTTPDKVDGLLTKNKGKIPHPPQAVAVGIPKETIAKRPDIHQARLQAIAQSELIGAAKANLFPALSLTGTFAFAANDINNASLGNLFNWGNRTVTAGPGFSWPLLNYGQITNAVRQQDALFQQSLLNYVNLVLKAQQEVQDSMTQFVEMKKAENFLNKANHSAIKSTQLALIRYREGESDFTPVLDSERQQLQVQTSLTKAQGNTPKALISLYRALGGGWQIHHCKDIVPNKIKAQMAKRTNWGRLLKTKNHLPPLSKAQKVRELYLPNW